MRFLWRRLGYALVFLVLLAFPIGPLFPWSPVTPGYSRIRLDRAEVLFPEGTQLDRAFLGMDAIIADAERFHQLPVHKRITVVLCRDWSDFARFMPIVRGKGVAAVTLLTGTVIYVTPKIREKNLDTAEFLRHETSHAAIHQNQSLWHGWKLLRQQWFLEGLAVSFGRQTSYVTVDEFLTGAKTVELGTVIGAEENPPSQNIRFNYQAWRYFLEHLISKRGRGKFQEFLLAEMAHPDEYRSSFLQVYGIPITDAVSLFQGELQRASWQPDPNFADR